MKHLLKDLGGRGHIVTTDNFFTSVPLFLDLLAQGIMATGTLRANKKYILRRMCTRDVTKKTILVGLITRCMKKGTYVACYGKTGMLWCSCLYMPKQFHHQVNDSLCTVK